MAKQVIRIAYPPFDWFPECGLEGLYPSEDSCEHWYLRLTLRACTIIFGNTNLALKFIQSDSYGLESSSVHDFSPNSSLGLIEQGKADITTMMSLTELRFDKFPNLGVVGYSGRLFVYKKQENEHPGVGRDLFSWTFHVFIGVLFAWFLGLKLSPRLIQSIFQQNHELQSKGTENQQSTSRYIVRWINFQRGVFWLFLGVTLQYLATKFTLLFNVPSPVVRPFTNEHDLHQALLRKEFKLVVSTELELREFCPPPSGMLPTLFFLCFEDREIICSMDYVWVEHGHTFTYYYSNTSLPIQGRISFAQMRIISKQMTFENEFSIKNTVCDKSKPKQTNQALSFNQMGLVFGPYSMVLILAVLVVIGESVVFYLLQNRVENEFDFVQRAKRNKNDQFCEECWAIIQNLTDYDLDVIRKGHE